ncbi:MAG TPA: pentapeptide repeat-containing protein [Methylomirabilota bacterium]|nr:pentapeptide repeat-containing protein [Methylomirabilota bacterium]
MGEQVRMAPDRAAIKEIEELKSEIAVGSSAPQQKREEAAHPEEIPSHEATMGISLLELAEVLDQHKQWVESGGETGVKADLSGISLPKADLTGVNLQGAHLHRVNLEGADLSMANLRGASLVRANLSNSNLLGTELRGANLMGANLYGADGLWFGRLGGTNLFDAVLPESISAVDSSRAISDATKVARWFYFLNIAASLICCLLIAFTSDVRLLLNSSALPFGRFGKLLPMTGLYLGGPLVLLALSLRFHFLLLRLWGSMAALPAVFPDGQTLEKDGPWYLMGLVRRHFRWQGELRSAMTAFETALSTVLAYWIVPATLFFFWLRYLTRQDFRGTLLHVFLMTVAVATATSVPFVVSRVLRPGDIRLPKSKNIIFMILRTTRAALAVGCILFAISLGVNRGLPSDRNAAVEESPADPRRWAAMVFQSVGYRPYAELTEATLSTPLPRGEAWTDENIENISGARLNQMNLRYARAYRAFLANAKLWRANLEGAYFSEADLRNANLRESLLRNGVFDRALLSHAVMVSANATGANFSAADLRFSDLSYGTFEDAVLSNARVSGASLYAVNLRNARLLRTDLSRTDMRDTRLERAVLSFANLEQTDLSSARLAEANLTGALCKGTIFLDADLRKADLRGISALGAIFRGVEIEGANLAGADLRGASGISAMQICAALHGRSALMDADLAAEVQIHCPSAQ